MKGEVDGNLSLERLDCHQTNFSITKSMTSRHYMLPDVIQCEGEVPCMKYSCPPSPPPK